MNHPVRETPVSASQGSRPLILLTDPIHAAEMERLNRCGDVVRVPVQEVDRFKELATRARVLVVRSKLPVDLFDTTPGLLGVVRHGSGVDLIPVASATEKGIVVCNVPGANGNSVAEYCVAALLDAARSLHRIHVKLLDAGWETSRSMANEATELADKTLGIVGMGNIGSRMAQIAHLGFGMKVSAYRRGPAMNVADHVDQVSLDRLFAESDYIVLCCPLNESTRGLVDARLLDLCKPHAWIVNVSRGGRQAAAYGSMRRMSQGALDAVEAILRHDIPPNVVNPDVLETSDVRLRLHVPS